MKQKKKPLTTNGWLRQQANGIIAKIDEILEKNHINSSDFILQISANVIRSICNITVITADEKKAYSTSAHLEENFSPFDNKAYWDKTEKFLVDKYHFTKVTKLPNVRKYELRHK